MTANTPLDKPLQVIIPAHHRQYPIVIGYGLLNNLSQQLAPVLSRVKTVLVVTDTHVKHHWGEALNKALSELPCKTVWYEIKPGESAKSLASAEALYSVALENNVSRHDAVIGFGGGVVGDLAGFVAATWYRGTRFIQIPTTLLAQVDSSVGGKVAVNYGPVKNAVGAFYQPLAVFADLETLTTLPERELKAGLAEVVKYGLIEEAACCQKPICGSGGFFKFLQNKAGGLEAVMPQLVRRCCEMKASVVQQDETEQRGVRALLNLGHTFGHAYEAATGYTQLLHGEAVAMGMAKACQLSVRLGALPAIEAQRYFNLANTLGLPIQPPEGLDPNQLLALMRQDKKADGQTITLVLPEGRMGVARVRSDVADAQILQVLTD